MFLVSIFISFKVIHAFIEPSEYKVGTLPSDGQIQIFKEEKPLITRAEPSARLIQNSVKTKTIEKRNPTPSMKNPNISPVVKKTVRPRVLIYHTHNRESWLPELQDKTKPEEAFDSKINVTLLGKNLSKKLTEKGISVIHSTDDYPSKINNFDYAKSHTYSKVTLSEELSKNKSIDYVFDLHRDSESKDKTTILYKDVNYAQVYFVVGKDNPNWKKTLILRPDYKLN